MQPQSQQNMYIPTSGNNNNGRTQQQPSTMYRSVPPTATRNPRHIAIQSMYGPTMHQGVVLNTYPQYAPRQNSYAAAQYQFQQQIPTNFLPFAQYFPQGTYPQQHQRGAVNVNTAVSNGMAVQGAPNLNMCGPGSSQSQMSITTSSVITGVPPSATNTVMGVTPPSSGQVAVGPALGNLPPAVPSNQNRRKFVNRLPIIDPNTNKNIFEDMEVSRGSAAAASTSAGSAVQQEQSDMGSVMVMPTAVDLQQQQPSQQMYHVAEDQVHQHQHQHQHQQQQQPQIHQMPAPQPALIGQTPIVSANTDAPSVEIPATPNAPTQKPRNKKILSITEAKPQAQPQVPPQVNTTLPPPAPSSAITQPNSSSSTNTPMPVNATTKPIAISEPMDYTQDQEMPVKPETQPCYDAEPVVQAEPYESNILVNTPIAQTETQQQQQDYTATAETEVPTKVAAAAAAVEEIQETLQKMKLQSQEFTENEPVLPSEVPAEETMKEVTPVAVDETDKSASTVSSISQKTSVDEDDLPVDPALSKKSSINEPAPVTGTEEAIEAASTKAEPAEEPTAPAAPVAPVYLIDYSEGQWSPNNPEGKKQYNRDQLMTLRNAKASRSQPELKHTSILHTPNLLPSFATRGMNNKKVQSMVGPMGNRDRDGHYGNKQSSMSGVSGGHGSMKGGLIHINLSLNQDVKLNKTDNAWKPKSFTKSSDIAAPEEKQQREKEELVAKVRGILNKLTPEKFDTLVEEIIKLKIDTPDKMEEVMVLVFEKAIDEPNFSVSYARLCYRLIVEVKARDERMESGTKTNLALFRNALLDKTEREFTQNVTQSTAKEAKLQPIRDKIKNCTDPNEKAELEAQLDFEERKIRRRSGGTVRFIGELFKISMLTGKIIHTCIITLLKPNSEDMLECMCKLLTTVGAKFEQTTMNKDPTKCYSLDSVIERMQAIANKTDKEGAKISSRVRFMLQDVIDLRKNKWQSTRNEAPKTMDQIEKETKNEQMSSQYLNYGNSGGSGGSNSNMGKRDDRGSMRYESRNSSNYGGSRSQRGENRRQGGGGGGNNQSHQSNDENWQVQTSKGSRSQAVDSNKLEGLVFNHENLDMSKKKMGGAQQFQWGNNGQRSTTTASTSMTSSNPFASLDMAKNNNDFKSDRGGGSRNKGSMDRDRYGDRDRGMNSRGGSQASRENSSSRLPQGMRGLGSNNSSMQKSVSHSKHQQQMSSGSMKIMDKQHGGISSMSSRDSQKGYNTRQDSLTPVFEEPKPAECETFTKVITDLIEFYTERNKITPNEHAEIKSYIERINSRQICGFLYHILTNYLHMARVSTVSRRNLARMVYFLVQQNFITVDHFHLAYSHFAKYAEDLIIDIPALWVFIFEFVGPLVAKNVITLDQLWVQNLAESSDMRFKKNFLKACLTYCTQDIGPAFTRNIWKKSKLSWTNFMNEDEVQEFVTANNFSYVENESISPVIDANNNNEQLIRKVVSQVTDMLNDGACADNIIDFINGNFGDSSKQFICNLTTALCRHSISDMKTGLYKVDLDCFQKVCIPVLQRLINSNEEREFECLYAMQLLVNSLEHPRGLLAELFGEIYDADVIPQESFIKWRDLKDHSAGKGVAVKGLTSFFNTMLSGDGDNSEDNN